MLQKFPVKMVSVLALSYATSALAAIESLTYTNVNNVAVDTTLTQGTEIPVAINGSFTVAISAGLDRRLRIVVQRDGLTVDDQTSAVINVSDLLTVGSNAFYGKQFTINTTGDGHYTIAVMTLALDGSVVNTENYTMLQDTVGPTFGTTSIASYGGITNALTPSDIWYTGYYSSNYLQLNTIADASSGIAKVELVSYLLDGQQTEYKRRTLSFDDANQIARFTYSQDPGWLPTGDNGDTLYGFTFEVTDKAGNVTEVPMQKVYYDTVGARGLKLVGVYDPDSTNVIGGVTGMEPYVGGMEVKTNPIKIMYQMPESEYSGNARGGYYGAGSSQTITDQNDGYVYVIYERPYGFTNGNYVRWQDRRSWAVAGLSYNLVLADSAPQPLQRTGNYYLYSDIGWSSWTRVYVQNDILPITVNGVRVTIKPVSYDAVYSHHGLTCTIPAQESSCDIIYPTPIELNPGTNGYLHEGSSIAAADGSLYGEPGWADVDWNDHYYPVISASLTDGILTSNVYQEGAGAYFDRLRVRDIWLETTDGTKLSPTIMETSRASTNWVRIWNLNTLAEGDYQIKVGAQEMHGPLTISDETFHFISDQTKPSIAFGYESSSSVPATVSEVRGITISLSDNLSEASVKQLKLTSSDGVVNVILGYSLSSTDAEGKNKVFTPELPRLFPTLEEGVEYTLTVTATDAYGNDATSSVSFGYIPDNLITLSTITTLAVSYPIKNHDDQYIAEITSTELKLDDGRMATGPQFASITLKSNAAYPIVIQGQTIAPGQTKDLTIDLGSEGGKLAIPIYPAEDNVEGAAEILFEIPQLTSAYD